MKDKIKFIIKTTRKDIFNVLGFGISVASILTLLLIYFLIFIFGKITIIEFNYIILSIEIILSIIGLILIIKHFIGEYK